MLPERPCASEGDLGGVLGGSLGKFTFEAEVVLSRPGIEFQHLVPEGEAFGTTPSHDCG